MLPVRPDYPVAWRGRLICDVSQVPEVTAEALEFLLCQHCNEPEIRARNLALVEACNNAILHADASARCFPIQVEALCRQEWIELRITDHTAGFDWPARLELPRPDQESGRGLYLIRSVMDTVAYHRGAGENVLVLCRSRVSLG